MQIHLNPRNLFVFLVVVAFVYLGYLLWSSNDSYPDMAIDLRDVINYAVLAVEMGGHAVKKIYEENQLNIQTKGQTDVGKAELLTKADLVSNHLIMDLLQRFPLLQVITEEKSEKLFDAEVEKYRSDNYAIWLNLRRALEKLPSRKYDLSRITLWIDPLDATQEFTEGLVEYVTVMACIAIDGKPFFGAIYRPFFNETTFGMADWGLMDANGNKLTVKTEKETAKKIVVSRSHTGKVAEMAKSAFGDSYVVEPAGGAGYKTLRLLNGSAEFYMHSTAIKKWDVCAGDALIRSAGGTLIDLDGRSLDYSASSNPLNKKGLIMAVRNAFSTLSQLKPFLKS
jgi:inositol monophosphatase 3